MSYHDPLTGLYNRRFLEESLKSMDTKSQLPLAVVMGDVNGLKITNDVFGHETGDQLLKSVADTFRETCRKSDILARWGGDEFLLLMPRTSLKEAEHFIERLKSGFSEKSEGNLQLSVSLGCSVKNTEKEDLQRALREAEEGMYHQKLLEGSSYRNAIISTLLATLYEKSMETEEHAERLKAYCHAMGSALQLSSDELNELTLLAILHDIGKVGVHQSILQKPGRYLRRNGKKCGGIQRSVTGSPRTRRSFRWFRIISCLTMSAGTVKAIPGIFPARISPSMPHPCGRGCV